MNIQNQFPILKQRINGKKLIYFDNAATTQKPKKVIDTIVKFYSESNANVNRGMHSLSEKATQLFENSRTTVAKFLNAFDKEIIFTRNATESLNLISYSIENILTPEKNEIVLTEMEHHANLVPWQQLAKRKNMKLVFIKIKPDFSLDYEDAKNKINSKTAIVSLTWKSNVTGIKNNVQEIIKLAEKNRAISIIDACQVATTEKIDIKKLNCDFLVFSGHKTFGPTGIGILYGKGSLLDKMNPFNFGGGMISKVTEESSEWNSIPYKFEAGTPNIEGAIGLKTAIDFIEEIGLDKIKKIEKELTEYAIKELSKLDFVEVYGKKAEGIISFNLKNTHPHDVSCLLNDYGICIRAGHHCAMPLTKKISEKGTCRISFSIYNTKKEIDFFIKALKKAKETLA